MKTLKAILLATLLFSAPNLVSAQKDVQKDTCFSVPTELKINGSTLIINNKCQVVTFRFQLLNRWGNLYYESNSLTSPMDLNLSEKVSKKKDAANKYQEGVYFWRIEYTSPEAPEVKKTTTGFINIY